MITRTADKEQSVNNPDLLSKLKQNFHMNTWQNVLHAIGLMGVIDNQQLIEITSLGRDSLSRLMERMNEIAGDQSRLFQQTHLKIRRGTTGRTPKIYCLTNDGAALLRILGSPSAHAYQETNPIGVSHDLCILDLYLAAHRFNKDSKLEERIYFKENEYLLPDLQIKLDNGLPGLFEIEQAVRPNYLRRMAESLHRRLSFFQTDLGRLYSPDIRMIFNLPINSREFSTALERWHNLLALLSTQSGIELPFRLLAMPLQSFLDAPDWNPQPDENRWIDIAKSHCPSNSLKRPISRIPTVIMRKTRQEDLLVLDALSQWFDENTNQAKSEFPLPDPHFFEVVNLIYLASHHPGLSPLEKASYPHASVFLLKRYLLMHTDLLQLLEKTIERGEHSMRWNPTTILSKMQNEIDVFLNYHGWNNRDELIAVPTISSWTDDGPKDFGVSVKISSGELLMFESEGVVPGEKEIHDTEKMLAWVLWSLMSYADKIGLSERGYW